MIQSPLSPCAETPASHHYSPACTCRQIPQQLSVGSESGPWQHPPARTTHHQCWRTGTQPHWGQEDTPGDQCDHNTNKRLHTGTGFPDSTTCTQPGRDSGAKPSSTDIFRGYFTSLQKCLTQVSLFFHTPH